MNLFKRNKKDENTDEFHKEYGVISNCRYILGKFVKYRKSLILFIITGSIAAASMTYLWSFIGKLVIDMIEQQASSPDKDIKPLLYLTLITSAAELLFMWLNTVSSMKMSVGFTYVRLMIIKERIAKTLGMEYEALETPEMLDRLQKAKRATAGDWQGVQGMMTYMQVMGVQIISVTIAVAIMTTFNPWIILIIVVLSFAQFLFFDYIRKKDKKEMWDAMMPHWRKLEYMENVTTDFSYAKDIRLFGMQKYLAKKQIDVYDEELRHWIKSRQYWIYNTIFAHGISLLRQLIIIGWLVYSVVFNGLSIGNFTLYTASAAAFSNAINEILQALSALRERSAHTDDYRSFMDIPSADDKAQTIPIPPADKYTFEFKNVSFKYRGQEKYALKNVNLTLHAGEKLAVVGLNGAGKSTFIKLLLRLYDVTEGCILMNGTDIRKFDRKEYYELFAPAFQDVMVFAFPVAENVSMKEPFNTDKAEAEKMLRLAGLGDKLDKLEKGVDTELLKVLYDDGVDLSGGEKQKLALARALYKKSKIIVLDEPTAALDALAEFRLYQSFNELVGDRTAVYISHRLSSTRFCDRVAMFKDGEMVEIGTHDSLMEADGAYADMFRVQAQYYVEDKDIFDVPCQEVTSNG
ncbi:ABC transporter ATP-binding protein [Huintestinicola butyrica]|uniref:ABC transporter ATP-binding protein n=1 Tax=Huintestinicola butyrica TaxID=2981728 RepID=UPI003A214332